MQGKLRSLIEQKLPKVTIAKELGCNPRTLNRALTILGINYNYYQAVSGVEDNSKVCKVCEQRKPLTDFYKFSSGRIHSTCKGCWNCKERSRYKIKIADFEVYKADIGCQKCGESRPYVLDFHHKNPKEKSFSISDKTRTGLMNSEVQKEISKCILLCANCHREFHHLCKSRNITIETYLDSLD